MNELEEYRQMFCDDYRPAYSATANAPRYRSEDEERAYGEHSSGLTAPPLEDEVDEDDRDLDEPDSDFDLPSVDDQSPLPDLGYEASSP